MGLFLSEFLLHTFGMPPLIASFGSAVASINHRGTYSSASSCKFLETLSKSPEMESLWEIFQWRLLQMFNMVV
jgi:hypothetical protein